GYDGRRSDRLRLAIDGVDLEGPLFQLHRILASFGQILGAELRHLTEHEGFALWIAHGANAHITDSGLVVLDLVAAFRLERTAFVNHHDVVIAAGRHAGSLLHLGDLRAIQEFDLWRPALEILRC